MHNRMMKGKVFGNYCLSIQFYIKTLNIIIQFPVFKYLTSPILFTIVSFTIVIDKGFMPSGVKKVLDNITNSLLYSFVSQPSTSFTVSVETKSETVDSV